MRILFDNKLLDATVSSVNANPLYPVSRLKDSFLKRIYKATAHTDTITILFAETSKIDCCYVGFTNANSMLLELKDSSENVLYSTYLNVNKGGGAFSSVSGVSKAVLTISSNDNIFLGTIGIGDTYTMPNPINDIIKAFVDNSTVYTTSDGQYSKNKIVWLRFLKASFATVDDIDLYNEIFSLFADVDAPIWVDCFENVANVINPLYCSVEFKADSKSDTIYKFSFEATEAR